MENDQCKVSKSMRQTDYTWCLRCTSCSFCIRWKLNDDICRMCHLLRCVGSQLNFINGDSAVVISIATARSLGKLHSSREGRWTGLITCRRIAEERELWGRGAGCLHLISCSPHANYIVTCCHSNREMMLSHRGVVTFCLHYKGAGEKNSSEISITAPNAGRPVIPDHFPISWSRSVKCTWRLKFITAIKLCLIWLFN